MDRLLNVLFNQFFGALSNASEGSLGVCGRPSLMLVRVIILFLPRLVGSFAVNDFPYVDEFLGSSCCYYCGKSELPTAKQTCRFKTGPKRSRLIPATFHPNVDTGSPVSLVQHAALSSYVL